MFMIIEIIEESLGWRTFIKKCVIIAGKEYINDI